MGGTVDIVTQILDRPATRMLPTAARTTLPPAGPAWYGAVMGTGILATLLQVNAEALPWGSDLAPAVLAIGWVLFVGLSTAFGRRVQADSEVLRSGWADPTTRAQWGMVSMGILAVGSATLTVLPVHAPGLTHVSLLADAALWTIGTALGLLTTLSFTAMLVRGAAGQPGFAWGLPVVPPMVSATTGAALVPYLSSEIARLLLFLVLVACFVLALSLGAAIFVVAYRHHLLRTPVPLAASTSPWIPLGVVGQSTAAAQAIAGQATTLLRPEAAPGVHALANAYGVAMLAIGVPLVAYAALVTVRGFLGRMPFSPGWWSLTFPIGTLALGSHLLGAQPGLAAYSLVGVACVLVLCGTWLLCATASARARLAAGGLGA